MRHAAQLALAALAAAAAVPAAAATSATMTVSAVVEQSCTLDAQPLQFGVLASDAAGAGAASSLAVTCTPDTAFVVTIDGGQYASAGERRMADAVGARFLAYELYSDAARTRVWGASASEGVSATMTGATAMSFPVYGRIEAAPATAGAYSDVVTVTVSF